MCTDNQLCCTKNNLCYNNLSFDNRLNIVCLCCFEGSANRLFPEKSIPPRENDRILFDKCICNEQDFPPVFFYQNNSK